MTGEAGGDQGAMTSRLPQPSVFLPTMGTGRPAQEGQQRADAQRRPLVSPV